ncbi:MAG: hypothetical protein UY96_C0010G0014 [Parcubacteria group bacterium GW2011_GWB1_56_8]|nr:MAG: hypothetical protein UY96_C0010G0014 [Parcubacteria group bacterium GW2011_GWB1_56_8]
MTQPQVDNHPSREIDDDQLVSLNKVAELMDCNPTKIRRLAREGVIPGAFVPPGTRGWRFNEKAVRAWIRSGK